MFVQELRYTLQVSVVGVLQMFADVMEGDKDCHENSCLLELLACKHQFRFVKVVNEMKWFRKRLRVLVLISKLNYPHPHLFKLYSRLLTKFKVY